MIEEKISNQQYLGWEADLEIIARIDNQISLRKTYLMSPWNPERDENTGGGRSSFISRPQEDYVEKLEKDKRLKKLEYFKKLSLEFIEELEKIENSELKELYEMKFIKAPYMTWKDVSETLGYKHTNGYNRRKALLEIWGKICGEC